MEEPKNILTPSPVILINSLRQMGYTFITAVADLIDNSITAGAKNIYINSPYDGINTKIFIKDDGMGMDEETLHNAMRFGSFNSTHIRDPKDLGRFGLGLKTASFSQCYKFTVVSKKNGAVAARCWDLEYIEQNDQWLLQPKINPSYIEIVNEMEHGTLVVWEHLDSKLISPKDPNAERNFNNKKTRLREHLSITYHRFIERGDLNIEIAGNPVEPFNPFMEEERYNNTKVYCYDEELLDGNIKIQGIVLPHRSYLSDVEYKSAGFTKGWTKMQGFYVYRADRLMVYGDWLGVKQDGVAIRQEHHYDLARIRIDITNGYDFAWDIDVMKSKATPPDEILGHLEEAARLTRKQAKRSYSKRTQTHRIGNVIQKCNIWNVTDERQGKHHYCVNMDNPYILSVLHGLDEENRKKVSEVIKLISETIPSQQIAFDAREDEHSKFSDAYENDSSEKELIKQQLIDSYMAAGLTQQQADEQVTILLNL